MRAARVRERIEKAAGDGRLVRVTRRQGWDRLDGAVVSFSPKWLLLAVEHDAGFDGHALVRVAHIRHVGWNPHPGFVERALGSEGHWPLPRLDGVDLSSTRAALGSLAAVAALLAIHYEQDHPDECLIGVPRTFGEKTFTLQTVDPGAEWEDEDSDFRYRSVSRIDVGNAYERRLSAAAGPPPAS